MENIREKNNIKNKMSEDLEIFVCIKPLIFDMCFHNGNFILEKGNIEIGRFIYKDNVMLPGGGVILWYKFSTDHTHSKSLYWNKTFFEWDFIDHFVPLSEYRSMKLRSMKLKKYKGKSKTSYQTR